MQHDRQRPSAEVDPPRPAPPLSSPISPLCVAVEHLLQLQVSSLVFSGHPLCGQCGMAVATRRSRLKGLSSPLPSACPLPWGLQHSACLLTQLIFEKTQKKRRESGILLRLLLDRSQRRSHSPVSGSVCVCLCVCAAIYPAQNCHINSTASETCRAYFILYFMIFSLTG